MARGRGPASGAGPRRKSRVQRAEAGLSEGWTQMVGAGIAGQDSEGEAGLEGQGSDNGAGLEGQGSDDGGGAKGAGLRLAGRS